MSDNTLKIKRRGEDGYKVISVRIKEDTLEALVRIVGANRSPVSSAWRFEVGAKDELKVLAASNLIGIYTNMVVERV